MRDSSDYIFDGHSEGETVNHNPICVTNISNISFHKRRLCVRYPYSISPSLAVRPTHTQHPAAGQPNTAPMGKKHSVRKHLQIPQLYILL